MKHMKLLLLSFLAVGFISACSQSESQDQNTGEQTLEQRVENYVSATNFDAALEAVEQASPENADELNEQIHLQYGIQLIYNAEPAQMRESANNALRQFINVLEINPENEKARAEIDQILAIYRSFPDRQPKQEILDKLEEMGFQV